MKIGAHVSAAGGAQEAPLNAHKAKCECFQFFSRSPQGGPAPELTDAIVKQFKQRCKKYDLNAYIHTPYYINLASSKPRIRYSSIRVIREELERASQLGVRAVMTHLGSFKDLGEKAALAKVVEGVGKIMKGYTGSAQLLLENSAGSGGTIIGDAFQDLGTILKKNDQHDIGVCFDTCHAFASGYDLRSVEAVKKTLKQFGAQIGLKKLKLIHANDSVHALGAHKDRHAHIGKGHIGIPGFKALMQSPAAQRVDWLLETPKDGADKANDLKTLKNIRP